MTQVSCSLLQYRRVFCCQSKSRTFWHLRSAAISLWWTWTVTSVYILVLSRFVGIGWRQRFVSSCNIFSISFFFDYIAPLFSFWLFSRASVILWVQSNWIPIKLTWERVLFTKASRGWVITWAAAFLQCSLIVSCISFSRLLSHDSIFP